jgi:hypothetical protein
MLSSSKALLPLGSRSSSSDDVDSLLLLPDAVEVLDELDVHPGPVSKVFEPPVAGPPVLTEGAGDVGAVLFALAGVETLCRYPFDVVLL